MQHPGPIEQDPSPGTRHLRFCGDTQTFTLHLSEVQKGRAWLRTNIGHAAVMRREIVERVERGRPVLGRDWFDIPMPQVDDRMFSVTLPLCEVGHFEAKCLFLKTGETDPAWPAGPNTVINVEPADTCCANIVYNAFVRQFGPNRDGTFAAQHPDDTGLQDLDRSGYTVIPPSGTFRDLAAHLDFIIGELGCRILLLLPIHPTPTTYARMGRFGSPYAALSFTAIDPALARFDVRATPLDQFVELVDAVHARNAKLFIDLAINHTGWAASLHESHPQWLVRDDTGRIERPGAWGVTWEDLTRLDYTDRNLWRYMAEIFLTWCRRGVDGFRCDAGYMVPIPAWQYITAKVRSRFPNTIFFLEGLGGKMSTTEAILDTANFNWAYSELFQNYDRAQIEAYLPVADRLAAGCGVIVHFAETHDNLRLAARSRTWARMRTALCALCAHQGGFGFANGVEWFATEKIVVHDAPSLNWGAPDNQIEAIRRLTALLKNHPVFHDQTELKQIQTGSGNCLVLLRHHRPTGKKLLIAANLDAERTVEAAWSPADALGEGPDFQDLLSGDRVAVRQADGRHHVSLRPGRVVCLEDSRSATAAATFWKHPAGNPARVENQRLRAKALDLHRCFRDPAPVAALDIDHAAEALAADPVGFCRSLNRDTPEARVIVWQWPQDQRRTVMVPPGHGLLVQLDTPFQARIVAGERVLLQEQSLPGGDDTYFVLFSPGAAPRTFRPLTLGLSIYAIETYRHVTAPLLFLPRPESVRVRTVFRRATALKQPLRLLGTNGRGAMLRTSVEWGRLESRYDALLAANLNPDMPENRWIMLTRCRAWLVYQGFSQEIGHDCLDAFQHIPGGSGVWHYTIPAGQGEVVRLTLTAALTPGRNQMRLTFERDPAKPRRGLLAGASPVRLILRPDIEDRNFHDTTKAYLGPEHTWPSRVQALPAGFIFSPDPSRHLSVSLSGASFVPEPEWHYMVHRPEEADRGLDPDSDLFSPGYLTAPLCGGDRRTLWATITTGPRPTAAPAGSGDPPDARRPADSSDLPPAAALSAALDQFVVRRGALKTVIAGYPWFIDWGRDALIAARGLIAAGKARAARNVLHLFGRFEDRGTLPNMIQGRDTANRDTVDAPLWFFAACRDLMRHEGHQGFLEETCGRRTVREVLLSIGRSYVAGTPNGIRMDPSSGLIFSPAHFTWMDTDHPAATPRQGYAIEIQALWYRALKLLAGIDGKSAAPDWACLARQVQENVPRLYRLEGEGYLSDCLPAGPGVPAAEAGQDDALRPNQLFAVTLDLVTGPVLARGIVERCLALLVPGALRSLADRPVRHPLEIVFNGDLLGDPHRPYRGTYAGDEDTRRKPAYHNGTAWTWLLPVFCEAWAKAQGPAGRGTALAWLASGVRLVNHGCLGHLPEILDGDAPHRARGCDAQAWAASEYLRVWERLSRESTGTA